MSNENQARNRQRGTVFNNQYSVEDMTKAIRELGNLEQDPEHVQMVEDFNREKLEGMKQERQNLTRIVIADTKPYPNGMQSVAFAYANDIEKQNDKAQMMEHPTGNYVTLAQSTLDKFLDVSNRDGDYPVFNAKIHREGDIAIPLLNTIEPTDTPFDLEKHTQNTPIRKPFVNRRLGTEMKFQFVPTQTKSNDNDYDLER